jgi:hypothetical protein
MSGGAGMGMMGMNTNLPGGMQMNSNYNPNQGFQSNMGYNQFGT